MLPVNLLRMRGVTGTLPLLKLLIKHQESSCYFLTQIYVWLALYISLKTRVIEQVSETKVE